MSPRETAEFRFCPFCGTDLSEAGAVSDYPPGDTDAERDRDTEEEA